jgi:hypothetical protein
MYFNDNEQHHTPHFHARYADYEASFDLNGHIIVGDFPTKQTKYVVAWADIHYDELRALWDIMQSGDDFYKIRGLE